MIDVEVVFRDRVQKLNAVADFELRKIAAFYNELDHPQITQMFLKEIGVICGLEFRDR